MKRLFLILALALIGTLAFAATTGTITLNGIVAASTNITVTPQAGFNTLDLTTTATNVLVAIINEQTNDHSGYTVTVASANLAGAGTAPFLKDVASGNTWLYTLQYNAVAVVFASGVSTISNTVAMTVPAGVNKNLNISYVGTNTLAASNAYADTLTFTIAGK
jgi:hypothetical protein